MLPNPGWKLLMSKFSRCRLPAWRAHKQRPWLVAGATGCELSPSKQRLLCSLGGPSAGTKWGHWPLSTCVPAESALTMMHKYEIALRGAAALDGFASRSGTDPGCSCHA